jgi:DNA (cytosine-5)-methyltransferase 1
MKEPEQPQVTASLQRSELARWVGLEPTAPVSESGASAHVPGPRNGTGSPEIRPFRVGSLFSGIGGFDLGLELAGMEVAWQAENDPFCNRVLAHHWPNVRRYGDVRDISDSSFAPQGVERERADVDLICGGFPCQDLSVAGKRAGLDGERSGLWFEFKRILSELRPTWCLVENVPGLLSSNSGRDFGVVLSGLAECGFAGVGWRVLDSRFFGVAQRRRRVFIVGGPSRGAVAQVLSLCEGCAWDSPQGRTAGERVAGSTVGSLTNSGRGTERVGESRGQDPLVYVPELAFPVDTASGRISQREDDTTLVATTLYARDHKGINAGHGNNNLVVGTLPAAMGHHGYANLEWGAAAGHLIAHSLRSDGFDASEDGTGRGTPLVAQPLRSNRWGGSDSHGDEGNAVLVAATLRSASDSPAAHNKVNGTDVATLLPSQASVRRLTPLECERLQGFPDGWTALEGAADGPRYRALGNAVTVSVIRYLGERIMAVTA